MDAALIDYARRSGFVRVADDWTINGYRNGQVWVRPRRRDRSERGGLTPRAVGRMDCPHAGCRPSPGRACTTMSGSAGSSMLAMQGSRRRAAPEAYLRGVERRIAAGLNPNVGLCRVCFISRWDAAVATNNRSA